MKSGFIAKRATETEAAIISIPIRIFVWRLMDFVRFIRKRLGGFGWIISEKEGFSNICGFIRGLFFWKKSGLMFA